MSHELGKRNATKLDEFKPPIPTSPTTTALFPKAARSIQARKEGDAHRYL